MKESAWFKPLLWGGAIFVIGILGGLFLSSGGGDATSDPKRTITDASRYIGTLEREKAQLLEKINDLNKKLEVARETVPEKVENRIRKMTDEIKLLEEEIARLKDKNEKAQALVTENKRLADTNAQLEARFKSFEELGVTQRDRIETLKEKVGVLSRLEKEKARLETQNERLVSLNQSLTNKQAEADSQMEAFKALQTAHETLKHEHAGLQKSMAALQKTVAELTPQAEKARVLLTENDELKKKIQALNDLKDAMKARMDEIQKIAGPDKG